MCLLESVLGWRKKRRSRALLYHLYRLTRCYRMKAALRAALVRDRAEEEKPQQYQIQTLWGDFFSVDRSNFYGLLGYLQDFITAIK